MRKSNIKYPKALARVLILQHPTTALEVAIKFGGTDEILASPEGVAHEFCDAVQAAVMAKFGNASWTTQAVCKSWIELLLPQVGRDRVVEAAALALEPFLAPTMVAEGKRPWKCLSFYPMDRSKGLKTLAEHKSELRTQLRKALKALTVVTNPVEILADTDTIAPTPEVTPEPTPPTPEPMAEVKAPRSKDDGRVQLYDWILSVRAWQKKQELPVWGHRQTVNGRAMLAVGFPLAGIKDTMTLGWDDDARESLGVKEFDTAKWGRSVAIKGETGMEAAVRILGLEAGLNIALFGGAGIGKTTVIEKMAEARGTTLAVISCNPETAGVDLYGFLKPGTEPGYQLSEASLAMLEAEAGTETWILLDEADAMETATALMWNRSLANKRLSHRFLARMISLKNVRFFAAQNTAGLGADEHYNGREPQDASFRDRFVFLRCTMDEKLDHDLMFA